jgi:hypothetical protein
MLLRFARDFWQYWAGKQTDEESQVSPRTKGAYVLALAELFNEYDRAFADKKEKAKKPFVFVGEDDSSAISLSSFDQLNGCQKIPYPIKAALVIAFSQTNAGGCGLIHALNALLFDAVQKEKKEATLLKLSSSLVPTYVLTKTKNNAFSLMVSLPYDICSFSRPSLIIENALVSCQYVLSVHKKTNITATLSGCTMNLYKQDKPRNAITKKQPLNIVHSVNLLPDIKELKNVENAVIFFKALIVYLTPTKKTRKTASEKKMRRVQSMTSISSLKLDERRSSFSN